MVIAALGMMYAGGLEAWRLASLPLGLPPCPATEACCTPTRSLDFGALQWTGSISGGAIFSHAAHVQPMHAEGAAGGQLHGIQHVMGVLLPNRAAGDSGATYCDVASLQPRSCMCPNEPAPLSILWQVWRAGNTDMLIVLCLMPGCVVQLLHEHFHFFKQLIAHDDARLVCHP
jgi:hypothetical protein